MKRLIIALIAILFVPLINVQATHNKGGEITFKKTGRFSYEFTITTYTNIAPGLVADRDELILNYGDGTKETVPRIKDRPHNIGLKKWTFCMSVIKNVLECFLVSSQK